jgi:hypothetical protein
MWVQISEGRISPNIDFIFTRNTPQLAAAGIKGIRI